MEYIIGGIIALLGGSIVFLLFRGKKDKFFDAFQKYEESKDDLMTDLQNAKRKKDKKVKDLLEKQKEVKK